jgi:hypothetical protein
VNLYSLLVYIEHNGNESPEDYKAYFRNFAKPPKNGIKLYPTVKENPALIYFWFTVFKVVVSTSYYTASNGGSIKD